MEKWIDAIILMSALLAAGYAEERYRTRKERRAEKERKKWIKFVNHDKKGN
jgi:hypothetical protein